MGGESIEQSSGETGCGMRRWNGWGDDSHSSVVSPDLVGVLTALLGPGSPPHDVGFSDVVRQVPDTRLAPHPLVQTDPAERVRHARGQSLPDLIALRSGAGLLFPDGVSFPASAEDVRDLLRYATRTGARIIPYGGGTSVVGHVNVTDPSAPVLTLDLGRLDALHSLDDRSLTAVLGAGASGRAIEASLRARGYTLGHFPQSFEYSTLGGWIATRSRGQQALLYGGIERLFAGGTVETPSGTLELPALVASSAGPDLREVVLGSEGRLGIITSATVRISALPELEQFEAFFFPSFDAGVEAVRATAQARLPLSMLRLSDATETAMTISSAGRRLSRATHQLLQDSGLGAEGSCMLVVGASGTDAVRATLRQTRALLRTHAGVPAGTGFGRRWLEGRFAAPYLRNALWELGYAVDTVETATDWTRLDATRRAVEAALRTGLAELGEVVFPFTHLSHLYPTGSSIYTTYLFRTGPEAGETLRRWTLLKEAVSEAVVAAGATISHQHGVGVDHRNFLEPEKGALGLDLIRRVAAELDPDGILNPGKLVS
jgi:alkyldihydroxyacetonephosphate synthase